MGGSGADWQFVRKHVLALFEGEALRTPVEEMNRSVRCVHQISNLLMALLTFWKQQSHPALY